jgi:hypothetical protein
VVGGLIDQGVCDADGYLGGHQQAGFLINESSFAKQGPTLARVSR